MSDYQNFIQKHSELFWSVSPQKKGTISETFLVETILNYGTFEDVKELFELLSLQKTASIFYQSTQKRLRHNYLPQVENFFRLYFNRHVSQYSI